VCPSRPVLLPCYLTFSGRVSTYRAYRLPPTLAPGLPRHRAPVTIPLTPPTPITNIHPVSNATPTHGCDNVLVRTITVPQPWVERRPRPLNVGHVS